MARWLPFQVAKHPAHRSSLRWQVARAPAWLTVCALLGTVVLTAAAASVGTIATSDDLRLDGSTGMLVFFQIAAAIMGVTDFPAEPGNTSHAVIAFVCSIMSIILPALLLGIVLVRIFTVLPFNWRATASLVRASELDAGVRSRLTDAQQFLIAIRWYKMPRQLVISNLRAEVFLNYRTVSRVDGSIVHRTERLKVLDSDDSLAGNRTFPRVWTGMPLTLWVPTGSDLVDERLAEVQGRNLAEVLSPGILVRLTGKTVGFTTDVIDEKWYSLDDDVQLGRFAPVHPAVLPPAPHPRRPGQQRAEVRRAVNASRNWRGWEHFEEAARYAIFGYGSLAHPGTIRQLAGPGAEEGRDYFVLPLKGWKREWTVCTDNTDPTRRVAYYHPGSDDRVDGQVLFLNVVPDAGSALRGVLVVIRPDLLAELDEREGNYERVDVTADIDLTGVAVAQRPDVVWTYTGKEASVREAKRGIGRRTAVIWRPYLDRLCDAFGHHAGLLEAFNDERLPPEVRIVDLDRRKEDALTDPYGDV